MLTIFALQVHVFKRIRWIIFSFPNLPKKSICQIFFHNIEFNEVAENIWMKMIEILDKISFHAVFPASRLNFDIIHYQLINLSPDPHRNNDEMIIAMLHGYTFV